MSSIRSQLKHDRTKEVATEAVHWTQEHRNTILFSLVGGLVLAAIILGLYAYMQKQSDQASAALGHAIHVLTAPIRQPGQPADPNNLSFGSAQERDKAALDELEGVAGKFPRTDAGKYAQYLAGSVQVNQGDNANAEKSFIRARENGDSKVSSLAKLALANLYLSMDREADAVKLYQDLIEHPSTSVPKETAEVQLAQFYESKNQKTDAVKIYEQIKKDNAKNEFGDLAQQRIAALTGASETPAAAPAMAK